ncbi:MAG: 16S rRNA (uracil(1498)-N(3))-methyltransferase [Lentisphaerae bacterium]|nr:16S rRNA (uracil(1498)-N(3))-methyltransferase [Lentisphaerota bacterium]
MHRFYVCPPDWTPSEALLSGDETRHLARVLRLGPGAEVEVFDGRGRQARGTLLSVAGGRARIGTLRDVREAEAGPRLSLLVGLPKGGRMDDIVEKATELGASDVWPVLTERVVARPPAGRRAERRARWQRIALSAAKQCGAPRVPQIHPLLPLAEALDAAAADFDLFLAGVIGPGVAPLRDAVRAAGRARPRRVGVLVGPEGDLTPEEIRAARAAGARAVSFGARVLRVDTAVLFALSVLVSELTDPAGAG